MLNNKVIEQDTSFYLDGCQIQYNFLEATNPEEAFSILNTNKIDMLYIDISSEYFDGIQLLQDILNFGFPPADIIAVTVLHDKTFRYKTLKLGIYKYIYKPYDNKEIEESLEKFFNIHGEFQNKEKEMCQVPSDLNEATKQNKEDSFDFDFDFDDDNEAKSEQTQDDSFDFDFDLDEEEVQQEDSFDFDFDEDDTSSNIEHNEELMNAYNKSHKTVSSQEFLEPYSDDTYDMEELSELEEDLEALVASILFDDDLSDKIPDIIDLLEEYNRFLYTFSEFEELCKVIYSLVELLEETDFEKQKRKKMSSKLIVAIIEDLVDWKDHVFIIQDAVDVFYINASILNSFILLQETLKDSK